MTREEAHYGEVHFCSFCKYIQFRYGDYYCPKLEAPIAESGYCDLFEKDGKPTPQKPLVVATPKQVCADCVYNMGGMCGKTGELAKKACSMWSNVIEEQPPVVEEPNDDMEYIIDDSAFIKECDTCADAYYNSEGIAMCRRFNAQLDMQDLTACEEYNEDPEVSNDETSESDDN